MIELLPQGKYGFRSFLESDFATWLDYHKAINRYEPYRLDGYLPDFEIEQENGVIVIEVKPRIFIRKAFPAIAAARKHGLTLVVADRIGRNSFGAMALIVKGYSVFFFDHSSAMKPIALSFIDGSLAYQVGAGYIKIQPSDPIE